MISERSSIAEMDEIYLSQKAILFDRKLVFLIGPSGSGKTVIGRRLAAKTGIALYDTDARILANTGYSGIDSIFSEKGEAFFRTRELLALEEIAESGEDLIVATGGGLPWIPGAMDRILSLGVSVYLQASLEELWKRLAGNLQDRPLLRNGGFPTLQAMLAARESTYRRATLALNTERLTVDEVCGLLATQISSMAVSQNERQPHHHRDHTGR